MIDKIISDYSYHFDSHYYDTITDWLYMNQSNNKADIKIRIFDNIIKDDIYIRLASGNYIYVSFEEKKGFNLYSNQDIFPKGYIWITINENICLNCIGCYYLKNSLVFCSAPDARTLVRAYRQNKLQATLKLKMLMRCNNEMSNKIIDLAHDLVKAKNEEQEII